MGAVARAALAGCGLLALVACSGGVEDTAPSTTVVAPSTTLRTTPSTTVAPSTTSAPTTTLSPQQQDEAEIRNLHDRFFKMLEVTGNPPNPDHPEIAATTTGIQRQRETEAVAAMRKLSQHATGDLSGTVKRIEFTDPDHGTVTECSLSTTTITNADGTVAVAPETQPVLTELRVVRTVDGWRVEDWYVGGNLKCVL